MFLHAVHWFTAEPVRSDTAILSERIYGLFLQGTSFKLLRDQAEDIFILQNGFLKSRVIGRLFGFR